MIDKIYYVLNPDSVSAYVDDSDYYISGDVNIPDVIWYNEKPYTVTRIGHDAFSVRNSLISVNTVVVNQLARRFYQVAQVYLDRMGDNGIDIALGTFTGLPFLVGIGPKINIKLVQIGAMTSTFTSSFHSAGINQTNHSLYINLYASVSLILPAYHSTVDSVTEFLVVESIINGEVPDVYLGSNNTIQLVPQT